MRTHSKLAAHLFAIAASLPAVALAGPAAGMKLQRAVYVDAADVALKGPEGVACDERGALVVADTGNARLLTFRFKDGALEGGTQVKVSQLQTPWRVQIDSKGFVLALDRRTRKIVRLDEKGAATGFVDGKRGASGMTPAAFKVDREDRLVVLDVVAGKVWVISQDGDPVRELALPKGAVGVTDVAADSGGRVYAVDAVTATVFVATPDAKEFKALSASLKEMISFPTYLTAGDGGKLYLVDQHGHAIVRLGIDGSFQGRELAYGAVDGALSYPGQLCINSEGDVFVADRANNRLQIFQLPR